MFNPKKDYFNKKLEGVQKMIWDLEFKREKTSILRENTRKEYDGACSKLQVIETQIKALPENKKDWTDEQKRLEDQKVLLVQDIEGVRNGDGSVAKPGYKDVMGEMDVQIHGSGKTQEYPDGINGIAQQIQGLRELQQILKMFIKKI